MFMSFMFISLYSISKNLAGDNFWYLQINEGKFDAVHLLLPATNQWRANEIKTKTENQLFKLRKPLQTKAPWISDFVLCQIPFYRISSHQDYYKQSQIPISCCFMCLGNMRIFHNQKNAQTILQEQETINYTMKFSSSFIDKVLTR